MPLVLYYYIHCHSDESVEAGGSGEHFGEFRAILLGLRRGGPCRDDGSRCPGNLRSPPCTGRTPAGAPLGEDQGQDRLSRWQDRDRAAPASRLRWQGTTCAELGGGACRGLARQVGHEPDADQRVDPQVCPFGSLAAALSIALQDMDQRWPKFRAILQVLHLRGEAALAIDQFFTRRGGRTLPAEGEQCAAALLQPRCGEDIDHLLRHHRLRNDLEDAAGADRMARDPPLRLRCTGDAGQPSKSSKSSSPIRARTAATLPTNWWLALNTATSTRPSTATTSPPEKTGRSARFSFLARIEEGTLR